MKRIFQNIKKIGRSYGKSRTNKILLMNNNFNFVRSTGKKVLNKENIEQNYKIENLSDIYSQEVKPIEDDKFEVNSIDNMIISLYKKSKLYFFDINKEPFENLGRHYRYYKFITENLKHLKPSSSEKLIKAICYFNFKDNKTNEILSIHLNHSTDKFNSASNIIYSISKLKITNNTLIKNAIKVIENSEFSIEKLPFLIPLINSLSELKINNEKINSKIDQFIIDNHKDFKELEITIIFKFYSQIHRYKYDTLELLLDRTLELINSFSSRSIILLTKSLADLNLKNMHILTRIKNRLIDFIKHKKKDLKNEEFTCENLASLLNNLVKLRYFEEDIKEFCKFEEDFFEILEDHNNEAILMMFITHCNFFIGLKRNAIIDNRSDKLPFKIEKQFK
jgi:hypothetical protein